MEEIDLVVTVPLGEQQELLPAGDPAGPVGVDPGRVAVAHNHPCGTARRICEEQIEPVLVAIEAREPELGRRIGEVHGRDVDVLVGAEVDPRRTRSEEHTSELQSQSNLVCRLLLEKKKNNEYHDPTLTPLPQTAHTP